jgi:CRISPR-associated protein Csx14
MAEASIPVDLLNPGQVFACLGFLEAAEILLGNAAGGFDWSDESDVRFRLHADGEENPFEKVVTFIQEAKAVAVSPTPDVFERDKGETDVALGLFPARLADRKGKLRNALLPIELRRGDKSLRFEYWTDLDSGRPVLRLWTATNGNSAWVRFRKLCDSLDAAMQQYNTPWDDPFSLGSVVAANFRLELRRNWVSLDLGFSPDRINKKSNCVRIDIVTYPLVELLAALGLSHARPSDIPGNWLEWRYCAWAGLLPPELARIAISQALFSDSNRQFRMLLEQPNDGGDLSISEAYEE